MKTNELMIGDLVYAIFDIEDENEDYITEEVPVMTTGVDENCSLGDGYSVSYVPIGEVPDEICYCFEPIPITAEILEKNGFVGESIPYYKCKINEFNVYFFLYKNELQIFRSVYDFILRKEISSVHELQHALRLCGLNKLADNFKI